MENKVVIDKNNFYVKFYDGDLICEEFNKYVKPYLKNNEGSYFAWNASRSGAYGMFDGSTSCIGIGDYPERDKYLITVEEFRRLILRENIEPEYEIY